MDTPREFNELMDLPHLRPAYGVNAPAIFRHIGFRMAGGGGDPLRASSYEESMRLRNQFVDAINEILEKLRNKFGANKTPFFGTYGTRTKSDGTLDPRKSLLTEIKFGPAADTEMDLDSWRARVRIDIHTEYYSITYILDQRSDSHTRRATGSAKRACDYEQGLSESQQWGSREISEAIKFFYDGLWEAVDKHIGADFQFPGLRFTEFRSFVLRDLNSRFVQLKTAPKRFPFAIIDGSQFTECRTSLSHWLNNNAEFVRGILKFNQLTKEIDQDANCVLCEVLDGNAIYGSSLGQYPRSWAASEARAKNERVEALAQAAPLRYFIVYNDLSKYQVGRLIRRTHVLGELRLATVFDLALLSRASTKIRALGNYIDELTSSVSAGHGTSRLRSTLTEDELRDVHGRLDEISSSDISGGLTYRVARSRYYAEGFRLFLDEMRVKRIEQWEPYDNFVKRRLYHVFRFISDVGTRYEALAFRVHRLTTAYNAQRLNEFQDNVSALVRQMTTTNAEIRDVQNDIWTIQVLGEAIGITAFAYYGGHIMASLTNAVIKAGCSTAGTSMFDCKELIDRYAEVVDLLAVILALILLRPLWNFWRRVRHRVFRAPPSEGQLPPQTTSVGSPSPQE